MQFSNLLIYSLIKIPCEPYASLVCDFLDTYSNSLRHDAEAKRYPDVMTFAFWARKSNIQKKKEDHLRRYGDHRRLGKGMIFHIAPSNVPVNCIFTYAFGLLAGNANIVRIPTKKFPQVECMCRVLEQVMKREEFSEIKAKTSFVRYDKAEVECTKQYSAICDLRVIWGGDDTIREIRKVELQPRSVEITFADRYSFGMIDGAAIMEMLDEKLRYLSDAFYNDAYLMDQNACSTPHLICWKKGVTLKELDDAKKRFWESVYKSAAKYEMADVKVSDKYTQLCEKLIEYAVNTDSAIGKVISKVNRFGNRVYVCELSSLPQDAVIQCRGRYGMFYEYTYTSLDELLVLSDSRVQTCAVYGLEEEELRSYIIENGFLGIDRIVPFGKTLDIDTVWDGYDMIGAMSRVIS